MKTKNPDAYVRSIPDYIAWLPPTERLYYCVGVIAIEWQSLIKDMMRLQSMSGDKPAVRYSVLPSYDRVSSLWLQTAKDSKALNDPRQYENMHTLAENYHILRDALIHGTPEVDSRVRVPGHEGDIVRVDMASEKKIYCQHVRDTSKHYFQKDGRYNLREWLARTQEHQEYFETYYPLRDIEYVAAHGLPILRQAIGLANHVIGRGANNPMQASPTARASLMRELPRSVKRLTKVQVAIPPNGPQDLVIRL